MGADEQLDGDLLVGVPVPGQLNDLRLPGGEVSKGLHGALAHGFPGGQQLAAGAVGEPLQPPRGPHPLSRAEPVAGLPTAIFPPPPTATSSLAALASAAVSASRPRNAARPRAP